MFCVCVAWNNWTLTSLCNHILNDDIWMTLLPLGEEKGVVLQIMLFRCKKTCLCHNNLNSFSSKSDNCNAEIIINHIAVLLSVMIIAIFFFFLSPYCAVLVVVNGRHVSDCLCVSSMSIETHRREVIQSLHSNCNLQMWFKHWETPDRWSKLPWDSHSPYSLLIVSRCALFLHECVWGHFTNMHDYIIHVHVCIHGLFMCTNDDYMGEY